MTPHKLDFTPAPASARLLPGSLRWTRPLPARMRAPTDADLCLSRRTERRPSRGQPDPGDATALAGRRVRRLWRPADGRSQGDGPRPSGPDVRDVVPAR